MNDPARGPSAPSPDDESDVDQLIAEREVLRQQVAALSRGRRWGEHAKRVTASVLVIAFALSFLASGVGIWLQRSTLNNDVWAERVVPLGQDPDVQQALAAWTTDQLMATVDPEALLRDALPGRAQILSVPLSNAVEGFVADRVNRFMASERFEELWAVAAVRAHEAAVATLRNERPAIEATDEQIIINLVPVIDAVLNEILEEAPGLVGSDVVLPEISVNDVPAESRRRLADALGVELDDGFGTITIDDDGKLAAAQETIRWMDRLVVISSLLTLGFAVSAIAISPRRRRTLLQLIGATALVSIAVRRVSFLLQDEVTGLVRVEENRGAALVVVASFVNPITDAAAWVLTVIAVVALITVITAPYPWVVALRHRTAAASASAVGAVGARSNDPETVTWIAERADALRLAGYALGAVLLWFVDLNWFTLLVIAVVVVTWQVALHRVVKTATETEPVDASPNPPPSSPPQVDTSQG